MLHLSWAAFLAVCILVARLLCPAHRGVATIVACFLVGAATGACVAGLRELPNGHFDVRLFQTWPEAWMQFVFGVLGGILLALPGMIVWAAVPANRKRCQVDFSVGEKST